MDFSYWQCPSNIALVKYWGKKQNQIPQNTSISFTLDVCNTQTKITPMEKTTSQNIEFEIWVDHIKNDAFKPKVNHFFNEVYEEFKDLFSQYALKIETHNTFPHSSGIASSASSFASIAMCLTELKYQSINNDIIPKVSSLARIGSGSACRSVIPQISMWGTHDKFYNSNDFFAVSVSDMVSDTFLNYNDTILIVESGNKSVSSSKGHSLLENHPFAKSRYQKAQENCVELIESMKNNDVEKFIFIVEQEALMLHALMMCSNPYYILMKPNTLQIINKIWDYRKQNNIPVCFTLDAGANVHLLYPNEYKEKVITFVDKEL